MAAKKGKRASKKVKGLPAKALTTRQASRVKGGSDAGSKDATYFQKR